MNNKLFEGKLVRLIVKNPQECGEYLARWNKNTEYARLLDSNPARAYSLPATRKWIEKQQEKDPPNNFFFLVQTLADDKVIGFMDLDGTSWTNGDTWVGIGIGEPDYWGKGYGTDAMTVMLRYAFAELNLRRVTLSVFGYNVRGKRSYEKCGFREEGRLRQFLCRDGGRHDMILMGILREEWEQQNAE